MHYHLHSQGQELGEFPIEELRRRRQSGELTGAEYIWAEGMSEWQLLDTLLSQPGPASTAAPVPQPSKRRTQLVWVAAILGLTCLAAIAVFVVPKIVRQVRVAPSQGPDGIEVSSKKVTWDRKTATVADSNKRAREFRRRQWLEGYKANADRTALSDADALFMIEEWIDLNYVEGKTNRDEIVELCDKLAGPRGSQDPLVLAVTGVNAIEMHEQARRLDRALSGFPQSRHKAYPLFNVACTLLESVDEKNTDRVRMLYNTAIIAFKRCFNDGSFRPEDQAEIAEILINGWGYNFFYRSRAVTSPFVSGWRKDFEWLALVMEGEVHIIEAWKARGGGFANTVSKQGWEDFRNHLTSAAKSLTAAWELRPDLPLAPCRMIYVALGNLGPQEMRLWFDRAVAAQVDYHRAWKDMRWGLRPRWHGSLEAMLALGKTAVDTGRFDTDVPRKFMDVLSDLKSEMELPFGEHMYGRADIWPHVARMYDGYLAAPSEQKMRDGWRSSYAVVAYLAGHYDIAREQLEALNWQPWLGSLAGWETDLSLMPGEIAARTGPKASEITRAESAYVRQNVPEALAQYRALADSTDLDARARTFVRSRVTALELEKRLAAGEWIDLIPAGTNDPAWAIQVGSLTRLPDGAVEVTSDQYGHLLFSRARAGVNFEVRGEFEVVKTSSEDFQAGLVMGIPNYQTSDWYAFRMKRNSDEGQVASFSKGWGKQEISKPLSLNRRNRFTFEFRDGVVDASINEKPILQKAKFKTGLRTSAAEFFVGLGAFNDMNETTLRYRGVQLRRL